MPIHTAPLIISEPQTMEEPMQKSPVRMSAPLSNKINVITPTNKLDAASPSKQLFADGIDLVHDEVSLSTSSDDDSIANKVCKTQHRLAQDNGELAEEPLLKENPHRFVLFPIQDNEVSSTPSLAVLPC
jgi:hypothetical protein